jgi:hypothetical protein
LVFILCGCAALTSDAHAQRYQDRWRDAPREHRDWVRPPPPRDITPRDTIVDQALSIPYLWAYVAAGLVGFAWLRLHWAIQDKVGALQGTAWELIRLMENTTPDGVRERARVAEDTTEKFAVTGNAMITRPSLVSGETITPDLTRAGLTLMERHANDAAQFRAFRGSLRSGVSIFLSLLVHRNASSAFIAMTEYIRRQRDRKDAPNLAELKMFFGLPPDAPKDDTPPHKRGLTSWDYFTIGLATRNTGRILDGLEYHPPVPAGAAPVVARGDNILLAMRAYLHTSNTYDAARGAP